MQRRGKGEDRMNTDTGDEKMTPDSRPRAVFSNEDFTLLKEAVAEHVKRIADDPRSVKFSNLYHRLGRLA
jgi:hypothetical protein